MAQVWFWDGARTCSWPLGKATWQAGGGNTLPALQGASLHLRRSIEAGGCQPLVPFLALPLPTYKKQGVSKPLRVLVTWDKPGRFFKGSYKMEKKAQPRGEKVEHPLPTEATPQPPTEEYSEKVTLKRVWKEALRLHRFLFVCLFVF